MHILEAKPVSGGGNSRCPEASPDSPADAHAQAEALLEPRQVHTRVEGKGGQVVAERDAERGHGAKGLGKVEAARQVEFEGR